MKKGREDRIKTERHEEERQEKGRTEERMRGRT